MTTVIYKEQELYLAEIGTVLKLDDKVFSEDLGIGTVTEVSDDAEDILYPVKVYFGSYYGGYTADGYHLHSKRDPDRKNVRRIIPNTSIQYEIF